MKYNTFTNHCLILATGLMAAELQSQEVVEIERRQLHNDGAHNFFIEHVDEGDVKRATVVSKMAFRSEPDAPWLGVHIGDVSELAAAQLGLKIGMGLAVLHVVKDSAADEAGLQKNDILLKFDDQHLVTSKQLQVLVQSRELGDSVELTLLRKGKRKTVEATLGERNHASNEWREIEIRNFDSPKQFIDDFKNIEPEIKEKILTGDWIDGKSGIHTRVIHTGNKTAVLKDDSGHYTLTTKDGKKHLKIEAPDGAVLYSADVALDAQHDDLPEEFKAKIMLLEKPNNVRTEDLGEAFKDVEIKTNVELENRKKAPVFRLEKAKPEFLEIPSADDGKSI